MWRHGHEYYLFTNTAGSPDLGRCLERCSSGDCRRILRHPRWWNRRKLDGRHPLVVNFARRRRGTTRRRSGPVAASAVLRGRCRRTGGREWATTAFCRFRRSTPTTTTTTMTDRRKLLPVDRCTSCAGRRQAPTSAEGRRTRFVAAGRSRRPPPRCDRVPAPQSASAWAVHPAAWWRSPDRRSTSTGTRCQSLLQHFLTTTTTISGGFRRGRSRLRPPPSWATDWRHQSLSC